MKRLSFAILFLWCVNISFLKAQEVFNIMKYGAVADGKTLNTKAIQSAVDACAKVGGGTVLIPNGVFMTGTVNLKSNVAIYLEPTAELLGSPNLDDYEWAPYSLGAGVPKRRSLIYANNLTNIAIYGRGTIHGNGKHQNFQSKNVHGGIGGGVRPFAICINNSTKVSLKEFTMLNGAFWNIKIETSDDVLVDGLTVNSRAVANNDGIDIVDCSNVRIANCKVYSGDDGICLKSNTKVGVKNVTITNCVVSSYSSAIKLGSFGVGGFENIAISNCALYDTRLSGINLKMVAGGKMDRITVSNITMHNVNGSIFMKLARMDKYTPGVFKNVIISNIIADGIGSWKSNKADAYTKEEYDQRIGITITGQEECVMENVTLSNIHLQFAGGGNQAAADRPLKDSLPHGIPKYNNFGVTPAYGINCQYVKNIQFNNITFDYKADDVRPAMFFQQSENVTLNGIYAKVDDKAKAYVRFKNQNGAFIINSKPISGKAPFCSFEESAKNISIMNNDFSGIKRAFIKEAGVEAKSIKVLNNLN